MYLPGYQLEMGIQFKSINPFDEFQMSICSNNIKFISMKCMILNLLCFQLDIRLCFISSIWKSMDQLKPCETHGCIKESI